MTEDEVDEKLGRALDAAKRYADSNLERRDEIGERVRNAIVFAFLDGFMAGYREAKSPTK